VVASSSDQAVKALLRDLRHDFALKDLGTLHYFLGIAVEKDKEGIIVNQKKYALEILKRTGMELCKSTSIPLSTFEKYSAYKGTPLDTQAATKYRSIVGALQYLTLTRPDIAFSVNKVYQYLHAPTTDQLTAVKRILRYVQGTINLGVTIRKDSSLRVNAFSYADWAGCLDDRC
jgi:hypothetical protein